jgi:alkylation response protein AidB-like acyl-CoA dehydrogenase
MYSIGFAALAVELARACLDDAIGVATKKSQDGVSSPMIGRSTVHRQIGENEATLRAADSYLRSTASKMWDAAVNRGEVELAIRAEIRMASTYAIRQAVKVVDAAYEICGAGAIFKRNAVQRRYQDIHVIVQQFQGRPTNFETAGRYYLGLDTIGSL